MNQPVSYWFVLAFLSMLVLPRFLVDVVIGPLYDKVRDYYDRAKFAEWSRYKEASANDPVQNSAYFTKGYDSGFRQVPEDQLPPGWAAKTEVVHVPSGYKAAWPGYSTYTGYEPDPQPWYRTY